MKKIDSIHEVLDSRFSDLRQEIDYLKAENKKLANAGHALYHALGYFSNDFEFMIDYNYFSAEKAAVKNWKELFNNDIPEPNYED